MNKSINDVLGDKSKQFTWIKNSRENCQHYVANINGRGVTISKERLIRIFCLHICYLWTDLSFIRESFMKDANGREKEESLLSKKWPRNKTLRFLT